MRIARFVHPQGVAWGVVEGALDAPLDALTVAAIAEHPFGPIVLTGERWSLSDVRLLSPILPSKVVAIGKNYVEHAREMGGEAPESPLIFLKPSTSVIGTGDVIRLPVDSTHIDFEGELAVIIGRPAKDVPREHAMSVILGYTVGNDVTARDHQREDVQFTRGKGYDSFCPIGPWIETELDPSDLRITTTVNGVIKQDGRTSQMVHDIATQIAYMSHVMTLLPGDVILTGTPAGVGPILAGDTVTVEVEGIGALTNGVVSR
ncbi:MAG: 2-hydroxyhepta-2,4-diene,7-dioate isomerase / 5-carboxymethyl-2-oxo-hex-3-ene,7-dioate [Jatrophihabitantaceae bacterium]|nr:2-hydroxyhepta-2,4-diene,7-dioate isomerase / 5-carboxymethyl-2-oxo-hex-3-ene,7-dioate [Jatrophihabitantaceae bacterium]